MQTRRRLSVSAQIDCGERTHPGPAWSNCGHLSYPSHPPPSCLVFVALFGLFLCLSLLDCWCPPFVLEENTSQSRRGAHLGALRVASCGRRRGGWAPRWRALRSLLGVSRVFHPPWHPLADASSRGQTVEIGAGRKTDRAQASSRDPRSRPTSTSPASRRSSPRTSPSPLASP